MYPELPPIYKFGKVYEHFMDYEFDLMRIRTQQLIHGCSEEEALILLLKTDLKEDSK
jgi:hypothetical protein